MTVDIFSKKTLICLSPSVEYRLTGTVLFTQIEDNYIWLKKIIKIYLLKFRTFRGLRVV